MAALRMKEKENQHIPVLLNEAVDYLVTDPDGLYVDATFGRGSHSLAILNRLSNKGRLVAFDKDPDAVEHAKHFIKDKRFTIIHSAFSRMNLYLNTLDGVHAVKGILFDLGVSSPQLDNPERGFSFVREGRLDMRMDTSQGINAMEWLAEVDEKELADVLWQYGEEKFSRRIARAIVAARDDRPITTTSQLSELISNAMPRYKLPHEKHPATRSFQAIRIAINQELSELQVGLNQALEALAIGGRLAVISFHSLEDRIVKQFIRQQEKGQELPRGLPVKETHHQARMKSVDKPIKPSLQEVNINPRARSAILRIAEKLL
jgi:16S rRNA (cytosine1402-N4)-methyltransferase